MKDDLKNIEKIDRYLNGQFSTEEKTVFEKELASDDSLARQVELIKAARNTIIHAGRADLKNKFDQFEKEIAPPVRRIVPFRWMAVAAAILALAVAGIWLMKNNAPADPQQLFTDHFEAYRNPILIRSGENIAGNNWRLAVQAYAKEAYKVAAPLFQQSLNDSLTIPYLAHFYRGVSLLAQEQSDAAAAIPEFDQVLAVDNDYRQQAMWYKGLALLKLNRVGEAEKLFADLLKEGDYKMEEVRGILEEGAH